MEEKKKQSRPRDAQGRFVKRESAAPTITEKEITRVINRIADGGEPTEESMRMESLFITYLLRVCGAVGVFVLLLFILWLFQGCTTKEKATYIPIVKTVTVETIVHDTIIETELLEYYSERETRDTSSYLTNPFAYSQATVTNGTLTHSLGIHPNATVKQKLPVTERIVTIVDSIPYPVPVPGPTEYIEHKPSPIERTLMWAGAIAIIAAAAWAVARLTHLFKPKP